MPIRFRRSVPLGMGLRVNIGKTGIGLSAGRRGLRYTVHSSGRRTTSVGVPGTGVGYVRTTRSGQRPSGGAGRGTQWQTPNGQPDPTSRAQVVAHVPKPGLFASGMDRHYYHGVIAYLSDDRERAITEFEAVTAADPAAVSAHLFAGMAMGGTDHADDEQIAHFEAVIGSDIPLPDKMMAKFIPTEIIDIAMTVVITENITARVPVGSVGAALVLAEGYQTVGRRSEAIGLIQQLTQVDPSDRALRLSLADLLFEDADYEGVVELTTEAANDDDLSVALLHLRGASLYALGHQVAAIDAFRLALSKTANRDPELLKAVRYERAFAYEAIGQKSKARADFERIFAMEPGYRDVRERLASA